MGLRQNGSSFTSVTNSDLLVINAAYRHGRGDARGKAYINGENTLPPGDGLTDILYADGHCASRKPVQLWSLPKNPNYPTITKNTHYATYYGLNKAE